MELVNFNAPGFIIYGNIKVLGKQSFERNWTLYNANGTQFTGKDKWEIQDSKTFKWSLLFLNEGKWDEAPYSPFIMNRASD